MQQVIPSLPSLTEELIQTEDTPEDLVKYVENERTVAPDAIVDEIQNTVTDPKQYYYDLSKKRARSAAGGAGTDYENYDFIFFVIFLSSFG